MDELHELREYVLQGQTREALHLIDELDAMSRHSTVSNLVSFLMLALTHLMKMDVEKRLTRSWQNSIRNALLEIKDRNLMGNKASYYLRLEDWDEYIDTAYIKALSNASTEAFGGKYKSSELKVLINRERVCSMVHHLLALCYEVSFEELGDKVDEYLESEQPLER